MIPALAMTGYEIGKGLTSRRGGSATATATATPGLTPEEQRYLDSLTGAASTSGGRATDFYGRSGGFFDQAGAALGPSADFYRSILGGSDVDLMRALGPEADAIARGYSTARKNIMATAPRGGGRDFALSQGRFGQAGDVGRLIAGARPAAATALADIGTRLAGAGGQAGQIGAAESGIQTGALGTAAQIASGAQTTRRGQDIYAEAERERRRAERERGLGSGLASLIGALMPKINFGGGTKATAGGGGGFYGSNVTAYADGGVVTKPTLALIGEEGPEAVVPLHPGGGVPPVGDGETGDAGGQDIRAVAEAIHQRTGLTGPALMRLVQLWLEWQRAQQGQEGAVA